jgi:hypothetical protein
MEQNKFDEQLKEYFQQHKIEQTNGDFTKRVMQKLPHKKTPYYIVYAFLFLGVLLFLALNGFDKTIVSISDLSIVDLGLSSVQSLSIVLVFVLVILSVSILGIDSEDSFLSL